MADVTDAPVPTGASEFDVPGDFGRLAEHFGGSEMFSVANAAALPSSGNWVGRMLTTTDTGNLYRWLGSAWFMMPRVRRGVSTGTTDGAGLIAVTHGLGSTPAAALATPTIDTHATVPLLVDIHTGNFTSTTFDVQVIRRDTNALFGVQAIKFNWIAVA